MAEFKEIAPKPLSEVNKKDTHTNVGKSSSKKELVAEHERLVGVLESPSHEDDKEEAKLQAKELKELKEGKDYKPAKAEKSLERANSLIKSLKESLSEEEMDLKKKKSEEEEEETEKGLSSLIKALKASSIAGLSRRQRMDAAFRAGQALGRQEPSLPVEPVSLEDKDMGIDASKLRPDYEPPAVPVRRVETPFSIPPKKCGDHTYKSAKAGPVESKPFWRR